MLAASVLLAVAACDGEDTGGGADDANGGSTGRRGGDPTQVLTAAQVKAALPTASDVGPLAPLDNSDGTAHAFTGRAAVTSQCGSDAVEDEDVEGLAPCRGMTASGYIYYRDPDAPNCDGDSDCSVVFRIGAYESRDAARDAFGLVSREASMYGETAGTRAFGNESDLYGPHGAALVFRVGTVVATALNDDDSGVDLAGAEKLAAAFEARVRKQFG
ncbi:hypothetical protein AB0M28_04000 [Streptomyces sp. NPDC051940]|uniref:hypothetical protein n=1 Tax=Streptomyces sp. NPDC051940 TaxID=3155675 RepID=UPI00343397DC